MSRKAAGTLLTFTGFHDPHSDGPVEGSRQPGPILSLLGERAFGRVVLLSTPSTRDVSARTRDAILEREPGSRVEIHHLELPDPTDYSAILEEIRRVLRSLDLARSGEVFIATASGTPQMHACWILLVTSGELPGRLLHVRPPRFVSSDTPMVSEVDLSEERSFPFPALLQSPPPARDARDLGDVQLLRLSLAEPALAESPQVDRVIVAARRPEPDLFAICQEAGIVGDDPGMIGALRRAGTVARYDEPVLIYGENGTGKELIAQLIHRMSYRSGADLITVNCSAIPEELAESILFGHKKGAFTGAIRDEEGKFRLADEGTLFLDEVGELSLSTQAKLLKAVENQVIETVGEGRPVSVNVRIVTATNRKLPEMVEEGKFRKDLYYRLAGALIEVPPLRRRRGDVVPLSVHFLKEFNEYYGLRCQFTPEALRRLQQHDWPGNVRELRHVVRAAAMLGSSGRIEADDIRLVASMREDRLAEPHEGFSIEDYLGEVRRKLFDRALELAGGSQAGAAKLLGVSGAAVSKYVKGREATQA